MCSVAGCEGDVEDPAEGFGAYCGEREKVEVGGGGGRRKEDNRIVGEGEGTEGEREVGRSARGLCERERGDLSEGPETTTLPSWTISR